MAVVFICRSWRCASSSIYMNENKIAAGHFTKEALIEQLNQDLSKQFGKEDMVIGIINHQVVLNLPLIKSISKVRLSEVNSRIIDFLTQQEAIERAFALDDLAGTSLAPKIKGMVANGYYLNRSGQIQIILKPQ